MNARPVGILRGVLYRLEAVSWEGAGVARRIKGGQAVVWALERLGTAPFWSPPKARGMVHAGQVTTESLT